MHKKMNKKMQPKSITTRVEYQLPHYFRLRMLTNNKNVNATTTTIRLALHCSNIIVRVLAEISIQ